MSTTCVGGSACVCVEQDGQSVSNQATSSLTGMAGYVQSRTHLPPAVDLDERLDPRLEDGEVVVAPLHVVQAQAPVVRRQDHIAVVVTDRRKVPDQAAPDLRDGVVIVDRLRKQ